MWRWDQGEPFGSDPADENPSGLGAFDLPLRLPGQYFDAETGLHYNYFRDYDPSLGRYGESDPIGLNAGLNTYAYVLGDPLYGRDFYGLVNWSGESYQVSLVELIGASYTQMDLFSECKCGRRYHILVHAPALSFGFGFKASATVSSVSFDDGERCPDPTAFLGAYLSASAGVTLGVNPLTRPPTPGLGKPGIGLSAGVSRYGGVYSDISDPFSVPVGVEKAITGSVGATFVNVLEVKSCCE